MKKLFTLLFIICFYFSFTVFSKIYAQVDYPSDENTLKNYFTGKITKIISTNEENSYGITVLSQKVNLVIEDGEFKGKEIETRYGGHILLNKSQLLKVGDPVLLLYDKNQEGDFNFSIIDQYRVKQIIPLIIIFFIIVVIFSGFKGVGSIIGMIISLFVILSFIVPQILSGKDPLFVSIVGSLIILIFTIYLAHGLSIKTTVAVFSTFITLIIVGIISVIFVNYTYLSGIGSEDAIALKFGSTTSINFKGLLLGGILIGALGVLDDVTTGLSSAIFELAKANPKYKFSELYKSGMNIGREHIASLVNTLVLAYAGVSMPLFIIFSLNTNGLPLKVMLNDSMVIEEVVRTLSGSMGLIFAVPLTTFIASYFALRFNKK